MAKIALKFIEDEFIEQFLNGDLYMKKSGYYINLEKEKGDKIVGDSYEGSYVKDLNMEKNTIKIKVKDEWIELGAEKAVLNERPEDFYRIPMLCFTTFTNSDFEVVDDYKMSIRTDIYEDIKKDFSSRKVVIITDLDELRERIHKAIASEGYRALMGEVKYYSEKTYPLSREEYSKDPLKGFFYKRKKYSNQKEYRLVIQQLLGIEEEYRILKIGDINDICFVCDLDDLQTLSLIFTNE